MSSVVGKVRTLRLFVEPLDVELDEDGGLQWSTLQTAFPGCSNLYYKGEEGMKTMVKCDGKSFSRPGGHWNDSDYYVTLGSRTMNYPFGSYENASKQFERSVNVVQQMLGGSLFSPPRRRENGHVMKAVVKPTTQSPVRKDHMGNGGELIVKKTEVEKSSFDGDGVQSIHERESLLRSSGRQLSPIEEQFVDLAKISNAKDTIIDQQREEMGRMKQNMGMIEKELLKAQEENGRNEKRIIAQEEELNILRRMSQDQTYMCDKVAELTKRLTEKELELSSVKSEMAERLNTLRDENAELQRRFDSTSTQLNDTTSKWHGVEEDLKLRSMEIYEMELELKRLRTLAKRVNIDSPEQIECYTDAMDSNARFREENAGLREDLNRQRESHLLFEKNAQENVRLMERNSDLEQRLNNLTQELAKINDTWKLNVRQREDEWSVKRSELELEKGELRRQISELQSMFESATRDVAETTRRMDEVMASREEMRKHLETVEYKHQESLTRETRELAEQLKEAQEKVGEMTTLVSALTSDANNSRRDVSDLI